MNIIGISALYHNSACVLMRDGVVASAAEEERFSRIKADPFMPLRAIQWCLSEGSLSIADVDCIAFYEMPEKKLSRQIWSGLLSTHPDIIKPSNVFRPENEIRSLIGFDGPILYFDHHLSHAASSFFFSGFHDSAILTVDGVGEWATSTYGKGDSNGVNILEEVLFPNSLGLLYSTITSFLGFGVNDGEYKVMGLAPYGNPVYVKQIRKLVDSGNGGQFQLDMSYFDFLKGNKMYSDKLSDLLSLAPRPPDSNILQVHQDVAKSIQVVLEEILVEKAHYLYKLTSLDNLCMAGGVALNCVANGQLLKKGPFTNLFVQPAANDAGGAIGVAALAHQKLTGELPPRKRMTSVLLGPSYSARQVRKLLESSPFVFNDYTERPDMLLVDVCLEIASGKVVGWFQGSMEFGPRSLGARSIIADPRDPSMRDKINAMVKKREGFRPFAPAVLAHEAQSHFDLDHASPFMLETCQVTSSITLPAITHVDNSARVQTVDKNTNPRFFALLEEFQRQTDCPILLNTSFNVKGEPIVCTPEDALRCFVSTGIDILVIQDFVIDKKNNDCSVVADILDDVIPTDGISHDVYTFL